MTGKGAEGERAALWLPLLRRLTEVSSTYVVWKQIVSALEGEGDIDSAADPADWNALEHEFRVWAETNRLEPVAVCNHIPGGRNLIAAPERMASFLELSIKHNKIFRGSMLFTLDELAPLTIIDPRGFRRVRPGAEGLLKLVLNGSRWGGRPNVEGLHTKHVAELLREDDEGARLAAHLFGPAETAVLALADAVRAGGWDRRAMLAVETRALLEAGRHPATLSRRAGCYDCGRTHPGLTEGKPMLVLTRRVGEEIIIANNIRITVAAIKGDKVRIGITAPPDVRVDREEVHRRIHEFAEPVALVAATVGAESR